MGGRRKFQGGSNLSGKLARRVSLFLLLVVVLVLGSVAAIFAWPQPATASVSGTVRDTDGPVEGALVKVWPLPGDGSLAWPPTTTDTSTSNAALTSTTSVAI